MKAMGLENVHTEKYTIGAAGREARRREAALPVTRRSTWMRWVGLVHGSRRADGMSCRQSVQSRRRSKNPPTKGQMSDAIERQAEKRFHDDFVDYGNFLKSAFEAGVIAVIGGQGGSPRRNDLTHRESSDLTRISTFPSFHDFEIKASSSASLTVAHSSDAHQVQNTLRTAGGNGERGR